MKKVLLAFVFLIALGQFSCTDRDDEVVAAHIRILNNSTLPFDEVQVGDEEMLHENVAPGDYSEYLEYETAYEYAYIRIQSGEETYELQPIDFVGEEPLPSGYYTYALNVDEEGQVVLEFRIDY